MPTTRAERVLVELQRRSKRGRPLNSGANRGDWLYAAAVACFGSWGKAVKAAGFDYRTIKLRPLGKKELLAMLREQVSSGAPMLARAQDAGVAAAARRLFGSWKRAVQAAGGRSGPTKWTPAAVIAGIRAEIAQGLPVNSAQILDRNQNLYAAGRRRFGNWDAALKAARRGLAVSSRHKRATRSPG